MAFESVKSVVFDFASNHGEAYAMGVRSIDFYLGASLISLASSDMTCYATSTDSSTENEDAFITALSKTGTRYGMAWLSDYSNSMNQRLIIVFNSVQTFDAIKVNNFHHLGSQTTTGAQNVKIHTSTDAITDTTYNAAISNSTEICDGSIDEHVGTDTVDTQNIDLPATSMMIPPLTLEIEGNKDLTGDIQATIPSLSLAVTVSNPGLENVFDMEIPSLVIEACAAPSINIELPSLTMEIEGKTGKLANIKAKIPSLTMESKSGINGDLTIPSMTLESDVSTVVPLEELTGNISLLIPALRSRITSVPDNVIDADIPMATILGECQQSGDNNLDMTIPSIVAEIDSGEIEDEALRYIRGLVR